MLLFTARKGKLCDTRGYCDEAKGNSETKTKPQSPAIDTYGVITEPRSCNRPQVFKRRDVLSLYSRQGPIQAQ